MPVWLCLIAAQSPRTQPPSWAVHSSMLGSLGVLFWKVTPREINGGTEGRWTVLRSRKAEAAVAQKRGLEMLQFCKPLALHFAAAAGLSYVGGYVLNTYRSYGSFLQDKYALLPAIIILCVAAAMFAIGLLGCWAACRESRVGLGLFLAIIVIIFIAEVSAFVLAFVYREKVKTDVQGTMQSVFEKYDGKNPESAVVDYLQEQLHCCGVKNYSDWTAMPWFNSTGNSSVPLSCCRQDAKNCTGRLDQPQELNALGCAGQLESGLQSVISYAMLVILGFAIVKLFGMLSVCVLACRREDSGYQPLHSGLFA